MRYRRQDWDGAIDGSPFADEAREMFVTAMEIAEEIATSLDSIADSLAKLARTVERDELGNASVRVVGEFIGGDGDIGAGL